MHKEVSFSRHAKNRMRLHRLTEQEVVIVLASPDYIEKDMEGRENFWKKVDNKYIRVTIKTTREQTVVITAVKKKRGWKNNENRV